MIGQISLDFELVEASLDDEDRAARIEPGDSDPIRIFSKVEAGRVNKILQLGHLWGQRRSLGHNLDAKWRVAKGGEIHKCHPLRFRREQLENRLIGNDCLR